MPEAQGRGFTVEDVVDSMGDVLYVVDREFELAFVNQRFAEAAGRPRESVVGTSLRTVTEAVARDGDAVDRYLETVRAILDGEREEARVTVPANTDPLGDHVVATRLTPYERDGEVVAVVGVSRDVSGRHSYERELETRSEELAVLNRVLRHDVRSDMAVVDGWLDELADRLDGEDARVAEMARDAARHTIELTETAREYAEVVANGAEPEREPVELAPLLTAEVHRHRALYPHASIAVDGELPDVAVLATPMLQSVFTNLLHNAVQHNPADEPTVTVGCTVEDGTVTVRIADDGPGIPDAVRERVARREDASLADENASLGLYLVGRLVDAARGSLAFADNEPRGTVATVELQRADGG